MAKKEGTDTLYEEQQESGEDVQNCEGKAERKRRTGNINIVKSRERKVVFKQEEVGEV